MANARLKSTEDTPIVSLLRRRKSNGGNERPPTDHSSTVNPTKISPINPATQTLQKPWKRLDVIFSTICLNLFALTLPIMVLQLYDRIIPNQAMGTLSILVVGVGIAVILESIIRISRTYILGWIGQQFDYGTSSSMFSHLMNARLYDINRIGIGEHLENIESLGTLKDFLAGQGFLVLLDLPFLFFFLGLITYLGGSVLGIASVFILSMFVISSLFLGKKLYQNLLEQQNVSDRKYNFLVEILNNYHTLKCLNMEELLLRRFERIQLQTAYVDYKINLYSSEARYLGALFASILFGTVIYVAGTGVIFNTMSAGAMGACLFLSNRVLQPLQQGMSMWTRFQHFQMSQKRFHNVFQMPLEHQHGQKIILKGEMTLKNVAFSYPHQKQILFHDVTATVHPGEFVCIIGRGGTGKTTLCQLLLGNLQPTGGDICFDGVPLNAMNMPAFRKQVAYLAPRGEVFSGTVMENITLFADQSKKEFARLLSRKIGLDRWVSTLPQGYDTVIGNQLDNDLPLGIQQRLCFVRALLLSPKILILDEANTNIDIVGDQELLSVLMELKKSMTILFVTHRPSVARLADRIFEIRDHTLVERMG